MLRIKSKNIVVRASIQWLTQNFFLCILSIVLACFSLSFEYLNIDELWFIVSVQTIVQVVIGKRKSPVTGVCIGVVRCRTFGGKLTAEHNAISRHFCCNHKQAKPHFKVVSVIFLKSCKICLLEPYFFDTDVLRG